MPLLLHELVQLPEVKNVKRKKKQKRKPLRRDIEGGYPPLSGIEKIENKVSNFPTPSIHPRTRRGISFIYRYEEKRGERRDGGQAKVTPWPHPDGRCHNRMLCAGCVLSPYMEAGGRIRYAYGMSKTVFHMGYMFQRSDCFGRSPSLQRTYKKLHMPVERDGLTCPMRRAAPYRLPTYAMPCAVHAPAL